MPKQITNYEKQVIDKFEEIAHKYNFDVLKGQGINNRIPLSGNTYFQFGDLRVETKTHHIIIEVESGGGVTNLAKYWYAIENKLQSIEKPIILMHIYKQSSKYDFGSHLELWDFLWEHMRKSLGNRMKATRYTYCELRELEPIIKEFENHLKAIL